MTISDECGEDNFREETCREDDCGEEDFEEDNVDANGREGLIDEGSFFKKKINNGSSKLNVL